MAREVYRFSVTVPHGTLQSAPQVTQLPMPVREVRSVEVTVPPGPHGLVGFQFTSGSGLVLPVNAGQFIVMDGRTRRWDLNDYMTSGAWALTAYNTGTNDHTLEIAFECDLAAAPAQSVGFQPLPAESLAG